MIRDATWRDSHADHDPPAPRPSSPRPVAGLALITGRMPRPVLAAMVAHLVGTFLVLVVAPELAFQDGNPLLLTTVGEFVVKNIILIAGTLLVAAALPPLRLQAARTT